jgi:hypothetical protein
MLTEESSKVVNKIGRERDSSLPMVAQNDKRGKVAQNDKGSERLLRDQGTRGGKRYGQVLD